MTTQPHENPRPVEPWELDFTFGDRIRKARRVLGLTVEQMAAGLGVKKQVLSQWETGVSNPRSGHLIARNAEYRYGVPAWWLLGNEMPPVGDEGQGARLEGFEPPTFCFGDGDSPELAEDDASSADIIELALRFPPEIETPPADHLAEVLVLRRAQ